MILDLKPGVVREVVWVRCNQVIRGLRHKEKIRVSPMAAVVGAVITVASCE
jgi:hypothetical protein